MVLYLDYKRDEGRGVVDTLNLKQGSDYKGLFSITGRFLELTLAFKR